MINRVDIKIDHNKLSLFGDLDFKNVMPICQQCIKLFSGSSSSSIIIDFAGLTSTNSVVLALIVNCMRLASRAKKAIKLENLSPEVMSLAKASGLDKIILPIC